MKKETAKHSSYYFAEFIAKEIPFECSTQPNPHSIEDAARLCQVQVPEDAEPVEIATCVIDGMFSDMAIGAEDGRILQDMMPFTEFLQIVKPVVERIYGGNVKNIHDAVLLAYTRSAMIWALEEEYDDLFKVVEYSGIFDIDEGDNFDAIPDTYEILYISVPRIYKLIYHLVTEKGYRMVTGMERRKQDEK